MINMTKLILSFVLLTTLATLDCFSQEVECSTSSAPGDTTYMAHYGYNEVLESVLLETFPDRDLQLQNARTSIGYAGDNVPFHIPIKVWVYHNDGGMGDRDALPIADVFDLIEGVNTEFANNATGIRFYLKCDIAHVFSTALNTIDSDSEYDQMVNTYHEPKALNWHLIRGSSIFGGRARFPWKSNNFRFASVFGGGLSQGEILTTVHEIGHTLGLLHTHENTRGSGNFNGDAGNCYQESVSRTRENGFGCFGTLGKDKCGINGDAICDTDAAPNREGGGSGAQTGWEIMDLDNSTNCDYVGGGTDNWGASWTPPTTNYMSYLEFRTCRSTFSAGQIGVMHSYIVLYMATGGSWFPGLGGEPWYNRNNLALSSTVFNGETDQIYAPENIQAPASGSNYVLNSGSNVRVHGQESVTLLPGFEAKQGSDFTATVGLISNCGLMYDGPLTNSSGRTSDRVISNIDYDMIDRVNNMLVNSLERQGNSGTELSADDPLHKNKVSIFPNPIEDKAQILTNIEGVSSMTVEILDLRGNTVTTFKVVDQSAEIDLSQLSGGTYIYRIKTPTDILTGKIIKQ